jgi:large subunit ribosomal protein L10
MSFWHGVFIFGRRFFSEVKHSMPNAKVLSEKQAIVENLAEKLKNSCAGVLVDYSGTDVTTDTQMRREMRAAGVDYAVVKNTLTRFAANKVGLDDLSPFLNGPTALAVSEKDPVAAAKLLCDYAAKKDSKIKIKVGFVEGKIITDAQVKALSELPSREVLVAQVLGTMIAPITGLATVLNANIRGLAVALNAIAEKKSA